ncbi:E3 ubiquitin-protein ligase MBR1-like isoform X2 [Magnolia sinica]|uniref:E3 ubiquitin-protein ligase MBR1-like isoform X2 n=1 Tax=Magnolia sinica TaxID=86752 RepID=UPI00265B5CB4|nr:E3 ubiquitin-protein ligase MBR1-like isoform X2 [Magnolia sinica]
MDEYVGKRASGGPRITKRGSGLSFRDSNQEDRSIPCCNRLGCSTRFYSSEGSQISHDSERPKYSRPSFRSSSSKAITVSSSKPSGGTGYLRKVRQEQRISKSFKETTAIESSSRQEEVQVSEPISTTVATATIDEAGSCTLASNSVPRKKTHQHSGSSNHDTSAGTSARRTLSSKNTGQAAKSVLQGQADAKLNKTGLRNLGCTVTSDPLPSGSSSLNSGPNKRWDVVKKRCPPDGESSSTRVKSMSGPSNQRNTLLGTSLSFTERSPLQQPPRRSRPFSAGGNSVASVRTRRTVTEDSRRRTSKSGNDNGSSLVDSNPQSPQNEVLMSESSTVSSSQSSQTELTSISQNSYGLGQSVSSSSDAVRSRPFDRLEDGGARTFYRIPADRDALRRFQMDGIAEQLLVLETNLFLAGPGFHDQHRDMRLDIDNMSYEELLALEEKMGTVSTALTEEALSNCLKRSTYEPTSLVQGSALTGDDDIKCSICQEEYVEGDEVGKLGCGHGYHVVCIHQWLRMKNWCTICKAPASPS